MANFIRIPLKETGEVDLIQPLKSLITDVFTSQTSDDLTESISELNKLRKTASYRILDISENSLDILSRYYDEFKGLESKVPLTGLQVNFKWVDAFDKGSFFGGKMELTISSVQFEEMCILFNIAALQSQIGANQATNTDDGLKLMAKLFQQASGVFSYIKGLRLKSDPQEYTRDLFPATLEALSSLMIAQAQESFFFKATKDQMKDAIIAKVSSQCEEFYSNVLAQMQKENLKPLWEKEWVPIIASKQAAYHGIAEYYQSRVAKSKKSIGEELARLTHSLDLLRIAESRFQAPIYRDWIEKAQSSYDETKKDNDFIYHESVPDIKSLPIIGKATLAKSILVTGRLSFSFVGLFESMSSVEEQATIDMEKMSLAFVEVKKLKEHAEAMKSILTGLDNLRDNSSPPAKKEKCCRMIQKSGFSVIEKLTKEVPDMLEKIVDSLNEAEKTLKQETSRTKNQ